MGLILQDADKKGLSKIGDEVKHLAQKAKENNLKPEDYEVGIDFVTHGYTLVLEVEVDVILFAGRHIYCIKLGGAIWCQAILCHY